MIELRNVTKYYPVHHGVRFVLNNVSLTIPTGANVAVLGPNGAGKSTFLRIIGGAETANKGQIITDSDISWPLGLASGFQKTLTGRQNVLFVCRINGLDRPDTRRVIRQVAEFAEIGEYFDMPVETYSSGMRARLGFGLSMAFRFDVYLIDELTSVGDVNFKQKAKAAFKEICKDSSLIYVSHNLNVLRDSCQSALFIRDGRADYHPNIEDGIKAYAEYARQNFSKADKPMKGIKKHMRKLAKQKRRASKAARARAAEAGSNIPQPPNP
jgi:capsular polysaccharide transport system ATP-binding protein